MAVSNQFVPSRDKKPLKAKRFHLAIGSMSAALIIGISVWWNYGWMLWNAAVWKSRVEAAASRTFGDAWDRQSRKLSGNSAIDCGRVRVHGSADAATDCALKAFNEGKPFRVRYDLQGYDSNVSAGLVYAPGGKLYGLVFDGDPLGQGGTSWSRQRAEKVLCPVPFQLYVNPNDRLNCFSKEAVPPHDIMSPNFEPY